MNFEVVFDVDEAGYRQWWFPAYGLIFIAIGLGILLYHRKNPSPTRSRWVRVFPYLFTGFAVFWVLITFVGTFSDYRVLCQALRSGQFELVEGKVRDFVPMPLRDMQWNGSLWMGTVMSTLITWSVLASTPRNLTAVQFARV